MQVIDSIAPSQSLTDGLPPNLTASLMVKVGQPLTDIRRSAGGPFEITFTLEEGLTVLTAKVKAQVNRLGQFIWSDDEEVYLKPAQNTTQANYILLTEDNFASKIRRAWGQSSRIGLSRNSQGRRPNDFKFNIFIYVSKSGNGGQRATDAVEPEERIRRANTISINRELNTINRHLEAHPDESVGNMTRQYWATHRARGNPDAPVVRPVNATFNQMIRLDAMQNTIDQEQAVPTNPQYKVIYIRLQGARMPIEIDVHSIRQALGLPLYNLYNEGIYTQPDIQAELNNEMENILPQDPDLPDEDHE